MGLWDALKDTFIEIGESPGYWYEVGKNDGLKGEGRSVVYGGNVIADLPEALRDAYHQGYDDGVRERD